MFYGCVNIIRISHGNVSTFLVRQFVSLCPSVGLFMPVTRASAAHHVGIGRPCAGQYSFGSLRCLNSLFAMF